MLRKGDDGRRIRLFVETPRLGELLRSLWVRSGSRTEDRTGEGGGNASSSGFRGARTLLGDPEGLSGRRNWGNSIWPDPVKPGSDCVRDIGGARLATERERECVPESGEVVRGRYGRDGRDVVGAQEGALGVVGLGSVLRR